MNRLLIVDESGQTLDEWPIPGIRLADTIYSAAQPVRLFHHDKGEARLLIPTHGIMDHLAGHAPGLRKYPSRKKRILAQLGIAITALVSLVILLLAALPYAVEHLARYVPNRWEELLGTHFMNALEERYPPCTGIGGGIALSSFAARIAGPGEHPFPVRIRVLQSSTVNAFAIPGGQIGIFEGLLRFIDSPKELAGVLAHEMAHNIRRHPLKSILRQSGYKLLFSTLTGDASTLGMSAAKITETLLNLSYSREAEREADRTSITMLNRAGVRSDGLAVFLSRLIQKDDRRGSGGYFTTHPALKERIGAIRKLQKDGAEPMSPTEWKSIRQMCRLKEF